MNVPQNDHSWFVVAIRDFLTTVVRDTLTRESGHAQIFEKSPGANLLLRNPIFGTSAQIYQ